MTKSLPALTCAIATLFAFSASAQAEARKIGQLPEGREVKYSSDIYPMLKKNCVACHNASTDEGGVNLESVEKMKDSDVEDILVIGKPDASRLFIVAAHIEEPVMPPEDNDVSASPLNPEELALLKHWIATGAKVDDANPGRSNYQWQSLPPHLRTVYASTMTKDGRLAAASFGNQIRVFGGSSAAPIETLILPGKDGKPAPPHLDFVQDLSVSNDGRKLISAGFRNVKTWELSVPKALPIPKIETNGLLLTAVNSKGTHIATLNTKGEVSVGIAGEDRWQWLKSFDLPESLSTEKTPEVRMAIDNTGESVVVAWSKEIRAVRIDAKAPESFVTDQPITAVAFDRENRIVTGDAAAMVKFWNKSDQGWKSQGDKVVSGPVTHLLTPGEGDAAVIAIDQGGNIATWAQADPGVKKRAKLPAASKHASATPMGMSIWTTLQSGAFGQFDFASNKFVEHSKLDPLTSDLYAQVNWTMLVGERLVAATDSELKTAQANEASEKKNIENANKDIEAKKKTRDEKKKPADDAAKASEAAKAKLAEAKATEKSTSEKRKLLTEKVKQIEAASPVLAKEKEVISAAVVAISAKIDAMNKQKAAIEAEYQKQLAAVTASLTELAKSKTIEDQKAAAAQKKIDDANAQKAAIDKELKALPVEKTLADAVKAATAESDKATKDAETKSNDLVKASKALELAEESKVRGEKRLLDSTKEVARRQKLVEVAKAEQEQRKKNDAEQKAENDKSLGADQALTVVADGKLLLTKSSTSGAWNLRTIAGDWITNLPEIPNDSEFVAAAGRVVFIRGKDGSTSALQFPAQLWTHAKTIGSANDESPFADRVLTVDVNPSGTLMATGGGEPSRNGELHIWNTSDGTLLRKLENPHTDTVLCVRFSPDGKLLASSSADRMVKIWNVETGALVKTLEGHTHHVNSVAWNVNNRQVSSASADASIKIWDISTGQSTRTISGLNTELTQLVYVGRDNRVGVVSGDKYFRVYRTDNGGRETNVKVTDGYLYALSANRDGTKYVLGGADGVAKIVDKAGKELVEYK